MLVLSLYISLLFYLFEMSQYILLASVYALVLAVMVAGYIFLHRVTDGEFSVFRKTAKIFFAWAYIPKVAVVTILLAVGVAFLITAQGYHTYTTVTGYQYTLIPTYSTLRYLDMVCHTYISQTDPITAGESCSFIQRFTMDKAVTNIDFHEIPVVTRQVITYLKPDNILFGMSFIILGLLLAAVFFVRANNELSKE